jgi:hypothetical protein
MIYEYIRIQKLILHLQLSFLKIHFNIILPFTVNQSKRHSLQIFQPISCQRNKYSLKEAHPKDLHLVRLS